MSAWHLTDEQLKLQAKAKALASEVVGPRAAAVDEALMGHTLLPSPVRPTDRPLTA